ncbi:DgyrCDS12920 [Dimorphilus gyrociliatus]|uniref:DgyrCDS12920 n=1 Tax=Dimorphilus gyrociliatus TaxID=2664684 RepID=A0A7I8W959_9ANNE|nr:DgyrCDS12920 [Dimorphilus gyrociliatus]
MPIRIKVIISWDFGDMNGGLLADFVALSKILDILLVFTRSDEYMTAKAKPTPNLLIVHITAVGLAKRKNVMRKLQMKPPRRTKLSSLPDALTIGVSMCKKKVTATRDVKVIPRQEMATGTREYTDSHLICCTHERKNTLFATKKAIRYVKRI